MADRARLAIDGSRDGAWEKGAEGGGSLVTSHAFIPLDPVRRPWERCAINVGGRFCGLAESAHARAVAPYVPDAPRAA
jgi:hypothetical protein